MKKKDPCDMCPNRNTCPKDEKLKTVRNFVNKINFMNSNSTQVVTDLNRYRGNIHGK